MSGTEAWPLSSSMAGKTTQLLTAPSFSHGHLSLSTTWAVGDGVKLLPTAYDLDLHLPALVCLQTFPVYREILCSPCETSSCENKTKQNKTKFQNVEERERGNKNTGWCKVLGLICLFIFSSGWSRVMTCTSHHSIKQKTSPTHSYPDFLNLSSLHSSLADGTASSKEFEYTSYAIHISLLISLL